MSFSALPNEILFLILDHVRKSRDTLWRLTTCSRGLHEIVTPLLYSHVDFTWNYQSFLARLPLFLKTILLYPSLASSVRYIRLYDPSQLHFKNRYPKGNSDRDSHGLSNAKLHEDLLNVIHNLPISEGRMRRWVRALDTMLLPPNDKMHLDPVDKPCLDAVEAALLVSLPGLERLEIEWHGEGEFIPYVLSGLAGRKGSILENLTQVMLKSSVKTSDFTHILPFLEIHSLTHLFTSKWCGPWLDSSDSSEEEETDSESESESEREEEPGSESEQADWREKYGNNQTPPLLSLVHVELRSCILGAPGLGVILKRCYALETFILTRWGAYLRREPEPLYASKLAKELHLHKDTLKSIRISHHFYGDDEEVEREVNPIDFFTFTALEELHAAAGYLVMNPLGSRFTDEDPEACLVNAKKPLYERLPPSLQVLHVLNLHYNEHAEAVVDALLQLIEHRSWVPQLRFLQIEAPFKTHAELLAYTTELQVKARNAGITVCRIDLDTMLRGAVGDGYSCGMNGDIRWEFWEEIRYRELLDNEGEWLEPVVSRGNR